MRLGYDCGDAGSPSPDALQVTANTRNMSIPRGIFAGRGRGQVSFAM